MTTRSSNATSIRLHRRAVLLAAAALSAIAVTAAVLVASAGAYTSQHPTDGSWATSDWDKVAVCDASADGHMAYAHIWQYSASDFTTTGYDTYGNDAYGRFCHHEQVMFQGIRAVQVCVQYEGCGPWKGNGYARLSRLP
jgi:hypothetical protein